MNVRSLHQRELHVGKCMQAMRVLALLSQSKTATSASVRYLAGYDTPSSHRCHFSNGSGATPVRPSAPLWGIQCKHASARSSCSEKTLTRGTERATGSNGCGWPRHSSPETKGQYLLLYGERGLGKPPRTRCTTLTMIVLCMVQPCCWRPSSLCWISRYGCRGMHPRKLGDAAIGRNALERYAIDQRGGCDRARCTSCAQQGCGFRRLLDRG
jgi:hypothetical protein